MIVEAVDCGGGVTRLRPAGEIDMATVSHLDAAMAAAIASTGTLSVVVDMAGVTFCDSSGIAAFDSNHFLAAQSGVVLQLINLRPAVSRVLEITGMLETLTNS